MLHEGHDLDMRVAHLGDVRYKLIGEVVIRVIGASLSGERIAGTRPGAIFARLSLRFVSVALPTAQMHLVDVEGALHDVALRAAAQPSSVLPGVAGDVPELRSRSGAGFCKEPERVGLPQEFALVGLDGIFVEVAGLETGNEDLPDVAVVGAGEWR